MPLNTGYRRANGYGGNYYFPWWMQGFACRSFVSVATLATPRCQGTGFFWIERIQHSTRAAYYTRSCESFDLARVASVDRVARPFRGVIASGGKVPRGLSVGRILWSWVRWTAPQWYLYTPVILIVRLSVILIVILGNRKVLLSSTFNSNLGCNLWILVS